MYGRIDEWHDGQRTTKDESHQVSLIILHPRRADQVVLLAPPVTKASEEIIGEEAVDWVSDDVDVHWLFYSKSGTHGQTDMFTIYPYRSSTGIFKYSTLHAVQNCILELQRRV